VDGDRGGGQPQLGAQLLRGTAAQEPGADRVLARRQERLDRLAADQLADRVGRRRHDPARGGERAPLAPPLPGRVGHHPA
jgi:hypothetical protein